MNIHRSLKATSLSDYFSTPLITRPHPCIVPQGRRNVATGATREE